MVKQHQDVVLSNETFDRFIAELDKPAKAVLELVELFKKNPKQRSESVALLVTVYGRGIASDGCFA